MQKFVLCGQVGFLFYVHCSLPLLLSIANTGCSGISIRNAINFVQILNNFQFFVSGMSWVGVSVDVPQRTDEVFEQNIAALSMEEKTKTC